MKIILRFALVIIVATLAFGHTTGCGGDSTVIPEIVRQVLYTSARALNDSDSANANNIMNIWSMDLDGSNNTTLTELTATGAGSALPRWSPDGSRITFESGWALNGTDAANTNNTRNIWIMNADGSSATPLTSVTALNADSSAPQWSPDGSQIAFISSRALDGSDAANTNNTSNVWVMDMDAEVLNVRPLTNMTALNTGSGALQWSADGTKIAFHSGRALNGTDAANANDTGNIWVINADGSGATPLTNLTALNADSGNAQWSPDGLSIVYESARALNGTDAANTNNTYNIWLMNADGSGAMPLTSLTVPGSFFPVWSPDGMLIVSISARALDGSDAALANNTWNMWSMNADGSGATPLAGLTAANADSAWPQWSQDGLNILFVSGRALDGSDAANTNGTANVWSMNADGSGATPLTSLTALNAGCLLSDL